jgi:hypothetical protein
MGSIMYSMASYERRSPWPFQSVGQGSPWWKLSTLWWKLSTPIIITPGHGSAASASAHQETYEEEARTISRVVLRNAHPGGPPLSVCVRMRRFPHARLPAPGACYVCDVSEHRGSCARSRAPGAAEQACGQLGCVEQNGTTGGWSGWRVRHDTLSPSCASASTCLRA